MANNVTSNPGSGGPVFATDEEGSVHWPYAKLAWGADDTQNLVTLLNPVPVQGNVGHGKTLKSVTGAVSVDTSIIAAVASKRLKIYRLALMIISTTVVTINIRDGVGGTILATYTLQSPASIVAGIVESVDCPTFLFATTSGTLLELDVTAAVTVTYNVSYWDDDAT